MESNRCPCVASGFGSFGIFYMSELFWIIAAIFSVLAATLLLTFRLRAGLSLALQVSIAVAILSLLSVPFAVYYSIAAEKAYQSATEVLRKRLAIVRENLDRDGVVYEYLDGKTKDRQARVERHLCSAGPNTSDSSSAMLTEPSSG